MPLKIYRASHYWESIKIWYRKIYNIQGRGRGRNEGRREGGKESRITTIKRPIKALADDPETKATLPVCRQSTVSELSFGAASRWEKKTPFVM